MWLSKSLKLIFQHVEKLTILYKEVEVLNVNNVTTAMIYSSNKTKEFNSNLDKDAFLHLLVTQLRYQNPLEPMKDTDFIAQMAQFTSLEQARNTNRITKINAAFNMIGKFVVGTIIDDSGNLREVAGIVESVRVDKDEAYLLVDSKEIPYEAVNEVTDVINNIEQYRLTVQNMRFNLAYSMLGREIKAKVDDEEITGIVESIRSVNGVIKLIVGEHELTVDDVYEIK